MRKSPRTGAPAQASVAAAFRAAKEFENNGEYEKAASALADFWPGVGHHPQTESLSPRDRAELLLHAGVLTSWLGESETVGAQQLAQGLISESIQLFQELSLPEKVAEAQTDLEICRWRQHGHTWSLAAALEGWGIEQARRGEQATALEALTRAASISEARGDSESAGRALLTLIEELKTSQSSRELRQFYARADRLLGDTDNRETLKRLRAAARSVTAVEGRDSTEGELRIPFEEEVRKCESSLIKRALDEANGSVTRAARILGLTHQGLCYIINHRHKSLLAARAPIRVRRKSLMKKKQ
jgi:tetratricopeptide (TPR) repeat protein